MTAALLIALSVSAGAADEEAFQRAERSAQIAGYSLSKVQRWLHEVALPRIDPDTGLYIADGRWNYRDTAADCYPFLVWAAFVVDRAALEGPVRAVLHAERRLCNHVDRIPVPFDLDKKAKADPGYDEMVFQASEYVKDGLIAIVEATGRDEWFDRMREIEDDLWKHARYETPRGPIPSRNLEVNGEQLQALARLYAMTGERKYVEWAERLAGYYLDQGDFVPERLRDHGCEIIGGLGLLVGVESERDPELARRRLPQVRKMLDEILARGVNEDGIMYNRLGDPASRLSDGWGYDYVANLCYDMAAGERRYGPAVERTLGNLAKPAYRRYRWEGNYSIDGFADSIEGAIYLLNRIPVPDGFAWVDREMADNVVRSHEPLDTAGLWGTMKLESNGVRTTIMHALMHTQGVLAFPWRQDLALGAARTGGRLAVVVGAQREWTGRLVFDIPRHRAYMGFQKDWPRMNTLPEWFVVQPGRRYVVRDEATGERRTWSGLSLHQGLLVRVGADQPLRLSVEPAP